MLPNKKKPVVVPTAKPGKTGPSTEKDLLKREPQGEKLKGEGPPKKLGPRPGEKRPKPTRNTPRKCEPEVFFVGGVVVFHNTKKKAKGGRGVPPRGGQKKKKHGKKTPVVSFANPQFQPPPTNKKKRKRVCLQLKKGKKIEPREGNTCRPPNKGFPTKLGSPTPRTRPGVPPKAGEKRKNSPRGEKLGKGG